MQLRCVDGKLECLNEGVVISNLAVELEYYDRPYGFLYYTSDKWEVDGQKATSTLEDGSIFTLNFEKTAFGVKFWASLDNNAQDFKQVLRFFISGKMNKKPNTVVYNTNTWLDNNLNRCSYDMRGDSITTTLVENQSVLGLDFVGFKCSNHDYGVIGTVGYDNYFSTVSVNQNGSFTAYSNPNEHWMQLDVISLDTGKSIRTDEFIVAFSKNSDVLSVYGKEIKAHQKIKRYNKPLNGWCSWYYYGPSISEDIILENAKASKDNEIPFEYIQIDDGWQICNGDWEANDRFPSGMKALADKISGMGFKPAIWVAPFFFTNTSKTFLEHKDWFINNGDTKFPMIDYSVEGARKYLRKLFRTLSREWGYRYIKIDLVLQKLAMNGFSKPGFTAMDNFREAMKIMRSAVTKDTVLLTCTSPVGPSAGVADSVRVGPDIAGNWGTLKFCAKRIAKRYYISQYMQIDSDCILLRDARNEDDNIYIYCRRSELENDTFLTFISAMGGATFSSDKLTLLGEKQMDKLKRLFPVNNKTATPLDIFERDIPSIYYYGKRGDIHMYALINWEDEEQTFTIKRRTNYLKTYYQNKVSECDGEFTITLKPHASEIVYFADIKRDLDKLTESIIPEL